MNTAPKLDASFWSGGENYGSRQYNSLHLLNKYCSKYPEKANDVLLSIKGAILRMGASLTALAMTLFAVLTPTVRRWTE
jgi:hypothetical protein